MFVGTPATQGFNSLNCCVDISKPSYIKCIIVLYLKIILVLKHKKKVYFFRYVNQKSIVKYIIFGLT